MLRLPASLQAGKEAAMKRSPCVVVCGVMLSSVCSAALLACSQADGPFRDAGPWAWPSNCNPVLYVVPVQSVQAVEFVDCFAAAAPTPTRSPPWTS
jgi:hypothetical protein